MSWNIHPSSEELAFVMEAGILHRDLQQHQEAREIFKGVRALAPASEVPEVALGTVAFEEGDFAAARKHYRRALQLNPRSAWAYAHLGEVAIFEKFKEEARAYLRIAIDLDPRGDCGKLARALLDFADIVTFE
jgi:tetratricopeptide (TPR) repeat protein